MRVIAGRYELVRLLGRGGMGEVWQAHDRTISRTVAVKLMPLDPGDRRGADALLREARAAGALHEPGVVTVHDVGLDAEDGSLFLVMAYLPGRDLASVLRQDGPGPVASVLDRTAQVAETLATAHAAGIVHRDLKPANLMLTDSGRVVVLDFGIARLAASLTRSSKVMGTLGYMAPERFDDQPGDARSDLYSLGCVLSELLVGELPFRVSGPVAMMRAHIEQVPEPPSRSRPDVPRSVDELVLELLAKHPEDRPADAASVAARLREIGYALAQAPGGVQERPIAVVQPGGVPSGGVPSGGVQPGGVPSAASAPGAVVRSSPATTQEVLPPDTGRLPVSRRRLLTAGAVTAVAGTGVIGALAWAANGSGTDGGSGGGSGGAVTRWTFQGGPGIERHPTVVNGVVYASSTDGNLYAIDAASGQMKWNVRAAKGIRSSPVIAKGVAYVADLGGAVYALDVVTRATLWATDVGAAVSSDVVVADSVVCVRSDDGVTHVLDAQTGHAIWNVRLGAGTDSPVRSTPVMGNNFVYTLGNNRRLYALNTPSGGQVWATGADYVTDLVLNEYRLYVGDADGIIHAIDSLTGTELWGCKTPTASSAPARTSLSGLVFVGGLALLISDEPCAIDLGTGTVKWHFAANKLFQSSCAVAGGVFYACADTTVYALDVATGAQNWKADVGHGKALTVTAADAGTVLVSDSSGALFAVTPPGAAG